LRREGDRRRDLPLPRAMHQRHGVPSFPFGKRKTAPGRYGTVRREPRSLRRHYPGQVRRVALGNGAHGASPRRLSAKCTPGGIFL
jgi:hypothetical protein